MNHAKSGCIFGLAAVAMALVGVLLWPYRSESIESAVSANQTGCAISSTSNGGWREDVAAPAIGTSRVAYPLSIIVFVNSCRGVPDGKPYSADLLSASSGKVIAQGVSCAGAIAAKAYPCRLELPPLASLERQDTYLVRVAKADGERVRTAKVRLYRQTRWRSLAVDAMMSV